MPDVISPLLDAMTNQEGREALLDQAQFQVPFLLDYLAVFLWAVSGAIVGMHKRYDFAGVLVVAMYLPIFHLGDAISGMGG